MMHRLNKDELFAEILIVEDNENSLNLLTDIMTKAGFEVRQAQDGEMALMTIQSKQPDLILLDVRMPHMDGFTVCEKLKTDPKTQHIPIIFLTANDDAESRIKGIKLGAVDYLGKPYNPDEVILRVTTNIELKKLQSQLSNLCDKRTIELQEEIQERKRIERQLRKSKAVLSELTGHLQEVREEERANISREIHDQLGQTLTVSKIQLVRALATVEDKSCALYEGVNNALQTIEEASEIARNISENLRPGMLDVLGLCPALEQHIAIYESSTGISCHCHFNENHLNELPERVAIAGLRIVQEALTNIAKHAEASIANIDIDEEDSHLLITISDNGKGFDTINIGQGRHFGLVGMYERVNLLNGHVNIASSIGDGTTIKVKLPFSGNTNESVK